MAQTRINYEYIVTFLLLTAGYVATAKLGFTMAFSAEQVTVVWPPTGIALAAVLLLGLRIWPAIALGAFLANTTVNEPVETALLIATGNTLEAVAGAWLLGYAFFNKTLANSRDILLFILCAGVIASMISATIGVGSLCLAGLQHWSDYDSLWFTWWLGDACGALIVAPVILAWFSGRYGPWSRKKILEALALGFSLIAISLCIFTDPSPLGINGRAFIYVIFPLLIWAALRFGQRGSTLVTFAASAIAIWATLHGLGPFTSSSLDHSLMLLQSFMAIVAATGLFLSAATSERHMIREVSRASRERLRVLAAIVESSDDAIISKNTNGIITSWNAGAERLFGYSAAEAVGQSIVLIIPPEYHDEETEILARIRRGERIHHYETMRTTKDGRLIDISLSISPLYNDEGQIVGASKVARDITPQKKLIEQLKESDRRKSEFLAILAHELRNPLAPMRNALNVLRLSKQGGRRDEAQSLLERQLQQMVRLVDDLLDISRITRGKIEIRKEAVELEGIVNSAVEIARPLIDERWQTLNIELPEEEIILNADAVRLTQILANLLNNAAKYTDEGGTIDLTAVHENGEAVITVRDNGIGIPPETLPYIFDMFMQTDNALSRSEGGLGIGLTLVKNLVMLHGGSVSVKSDGIGKGSEFTVRMPALPVHRRDPVPAATGEQDNRPAYTSSYRVLIVDDNKDSAETLGWMIELLGHEPHVTFEAEEAMALAEKLTPDLILLDIGLPGMNGYDICKALKKRPALKDTIFVAQTGWSQAAYVQRSEEAGFDYHLVKPIEFERLRQILDSITSRKNRGTGGAKTAKI